MDTKLVNSILSQKHFEQNAKSSLIWLYDALCLFRAAQVLYKTAKEAEHQYAQIILNEFDHQDKNKGSYSRPLTLDEFVLEIDNKLIRYSYFYLSRSLELLLKAILIERKEDYFFKTNKKGKKVFDVKGMSHKLIEYVKECSIVITQKEENEILFLQDLLFWGTFPTPNNEEELNEAYNRQSDADFRLSVQQYDEISLLFDKFLAILNEERAKNKRTILNNVFR